MRKNINVLVIPVNIDKEEIKYCVFHREDRDVWQFVAGGVEEGETSKIAALRELSEETELNKFVCFAKLDTVCSVPGYYFKKYFRKQWCSDIFVVNCEAFAVQTFDKSISLSKEHTDFKWLSFDEAYSMLEYDFDKTALWELNERLILNNLVILK